MTDSLDAVRVAHEQRAQALQNAHKATETFAQAIRDAKQAGTSDKQLEELTGLTRQRLWQLLKENGR